MGQPGMRVTVDAAMRARDVSRPEVERKIEDQPPGAAPPGPDARRPDQAAVNGNQPGRSDQDDRPERTRRSKAERRRLGKRHARARR